MVDTATEVFVRIVPAFQMTARIDPRHHDDDCDKEQDDDISQPIIRRRPAIPLTDARRHRGLTGRHLWAGHNVHTVRLATRRCRTSAATIDDCGVTGTAPATYRPTVNMEN